MITLTTNNNNNNSNNSNNKIIINLKENDKFLIIYRNIVLRREIQKQIKLLNQHDNYKFKSFKEFKNSYYRDYITEIQFIEGLNNEVDIMEFENFINNSNNVVKSIDFGNFFNWNFKFNHSNQLVSINLGNWFNKLDLAGIPRSCTSLTIGDSFNKELIPMISLPIGLKYLKLGNSYNKEFKTGSLPTSLEVLLIGNSFDFIIDINEIKNLKELEIGIGWNHSLVDQNFKDCKNLEKLKLKGFNNQIYCEITRKTLLPSSLKELKFNLSFSQILNRGSFPDGLEVLELGYHFASSIDIGVLPKGLKSLDVGKRFYYSLDKVGMLPIGLESIKFSPCSFQSILFSPLKNLNSISIGYYFKSLHLIPPTVDTLELDKIIPGIPTFIKTLKFSVDFNNLNSVTSIPSNIETLDSGPSFNQPLRNGIFSNKITTLILGSSFNYQIEKGSISKTNIRHLKITNPSYQYPLSNDNLPVNLETLTLCKYYKWKHSLKNISNTIKICFI